MSNKQQKKIRQLVRRNQNKIAENMVGTSWDVFFETISNFKLKYRLKLAWMIIRGKNVRKEEKEKNGITDTRN